MLLESNENENTESFGWVKEVLRGKFISILSTLRNSYIDYFTINSVYPCYGITK
jgi:hypothetical protein